MSSMAQSRSQTEDDLAGVGKTQSVDPLDVAQAIATRKAMSLGTKIGILQLVEKNNGFLHKINLIVRYLKCRLGPGRLSVEEFMKFGLGEASEEGNTSGDGVNARRFVGHAAQQKMHAACNDASWFATTKNKLLWHTILRGAGLAVPDTLAVYDRKGRGGGVTILENYLELSEFLSSPANIPVFCKPVTGTYSVGAFRIDEFDGKNAIVNGSWEKSVKEIASYFETIGKKGYLLQKPLRPDRELSQITGEAIATLRLFVCMDAGNPEILRAVLKVPAKGEVADNFWRADAQLWSIDADSGRVLRRIVNKLSTKTPKVINGHSDFPPTDYVLPEFEKSLELVGRAARHFPAIRTQSWDIAITEAGPVLMELNFGGDLSLVQMAHNSGILTGKYCAHLRECGYHGKLPA